jgi:hypothetical protein
MCLYINGTVKIDVFWWQCKNCEQWLYSKPDPQWTCYACRNGWVDKKKEEPTNEH